MNFPVKDLFSKCEDIRIKLRIYSNKSLTGNFIFCVVNIIGFTTESCKFFFEPNYQSLVYFASINAWRFSSNSPLQKSAFGILGRARTFSTVIIAR